MARNIQNDEKQELTTKFTLCSKAIGGQIKSFADKKKLKEFITTKPVLYEMLKVFFKKEEMKNITNKMAVNTYLSAIEPKKQNK